MNTRPVITNSGHQVPGTRANYRNIGQANRIEYARVMLPDRIVFVSFNAAEPLNALRCDGLCVRLLDNRIFKVINRYDRPIPNTTCYNGATLINNVERSGIHVVRTQI